MSRGPSTVAAPRSDVAALRAFVAVARSGAVSRAAQLLGRTQPSISARLAGLEAAWGLRLFRRVARGMALTPEGARLLPSAETVLRDLEELDRAAGLPVSAPGELRIGAGDALGREILPGALARLSRRRPELEVRLLEGPGPSLLEALRNGSIDVAFVVEPAAMGAIEGVDFEAVLHSEIELLVPGRPPRTRKPIGLAALARERLVTLQTGSGFRRHLEAAFAARRLRLRPAVEVGNLSLVRRFVAAGLGVAPVPSIAFVASQRLAGCERRRLTCIPPVSYLRVVRAGVPLPDAAGELIEWIRGA